MVWVELDHFKKIRIETERGKLSVYRAFAEMLAIKLGFMKGRFFPIYIANPVKVDVPEELLEFLKQPEKVIEVAEEMGYKTEVSDWHDGRKKWRNYWVFAPKYSGRIAEYVFMEFLSKKED